MDDPVTEDHLFHLVRGFPLFSTCNIGAKVAFLGTWYTGRVSHMDVLS